jgi:hypothetical protein
VFLIAIGDVRIRIDRDQNRTDICLVVFEHVEQDQTAIVTHVYIIDVKANLQIVTDLRIRILAQKNLRRKRNQLNLLKAISSHYHIIDANTSLSIATEIVFSTQHCRLLRLTMNDRINETFVQSQREKALAKNRDSICKDRI